MLFNSLLFLIFFIIVTITYYLLPHRFRWMWLLAASCYFYMYFKPVYILIILFTIIVDYCAGILIERADQKHKKFYLLASIITNVGVLAYFKYFNFLANNVNFLTTSFRGPQIPLLNFLLPIGLSFHTFQAMSYTIEVYRGNQKAEKHFGIYSLYVMFYPQMVAGPIERPQHILPQLHRVNKFNGTTFITGLLFIMIGLFKKMVIADRLALFVNPVYANPHGHSAFDLLLAAFFFAIQIYCDFSGYSDIAIGSAMVLGIELMKNFNYPFTSKTIAEFWRRWHISLSSWFNDYLFTPILIKKRDWGRSAVIFALFVTFFLSGLWHGAGWTFIIWGLSHAVAICYEVLTRKFRSNLAKKTPAVLYNTLSILITFSYVVLSWIFFRARNVADAFYIIKRIFTIHTVTYTSRNQMALREIYFCFLLTAILLGGEKYLYKVAEAPANKKLIVIVVLFVFSYFFGIFNEAQFIYFQF